jgi:prepilin-type N-terminal cleavage/methylation domain-containing protein/prepilin-type processing-associated H-X9-DG protein
MLRTPSRGLRAGFTLIELLVVIAIIAILASILFPVFSRARAKARAAKCLNNMKQLALAIHMYADDFDEVLPPWGWDTGGEYDTVLTWDQRIFSYTRNSDLLYCPDNQWGPHGAISKPYRSYAITAWTQTVTTPYSLGDFYAPSRTALLVEKGAYKPGMRSDAKAENVYQAGRQQGYPGYPSCAMFISSAFSKGYRHNDGLNFAFVDGHVKFYSKGAGPFGYSGTSGCPGTCDSAADWPQPE